MLSRVLLRRGAIDTNLFRSCKTIFALTPRQNLRVYLVSEVRANTCRVYCRLLGGKHCAGSAHLISCRNKMEPDLQRQT
jgi:hypothetical protein